MYFSGSDQYKFLSKTTKKTNEFVKAKPDLVFHDTILDWDSVLYSQLIDKVKVWYFQSMTLKNPVNVYPARFTGSNERSDSKAVLAGNTVYVLEYGKLYSIDVTSLIDTSGSNVSSPVIREVSLHGDDSRASHLVDISSSGKYCFGIDTEGGIYRIPDLIFHREDVVLRRIYSGYAFNLALSDTGAVYSWGTGSRGELGQDCDSVECETPQRIDFFDDLPSVVVDLACGGWHALALTSDGDIYSWGWNESGQLGHSAEKLSSVSPHPFPVDLGSANDPVRQIAAGARHSIAVLKSGQLYTWGLNKFGQLGLGDCENRSVPSPVEGSVEGRVNRAYCGRWSTVINIT